MKLVVDLPEWFIEDTKEFNFPTPMDKVIINGQPLSEILDKISAEIEEVNEDLDGYDPDSLSTLFCKTLAILERYKKEVSE